MSSASAQEPQRVTLLKSPRGSDYAKEITESYSEPFTARADLSIRSVYTPQVLSRMRASAKEALPCTDTLFAMLYALCHAPGPRNESRRA